MSENRLRVLSAYMLIVFRVRNVERSEHEYSRAFKGSVAKRCGKSIQSCIFASMETTMLEQLARIVLPSEILERFEIVQIETDEQDIDSMSMTIHLDERMNAEYQASEGYESLGFMEAVSVADFPIRDHKVVLKLRRRRWKKKQTGESFVEKISVTEKGTRYSKEFAAFLKETYGDIPSKKCLEI